MPELPEVETIKEALKKAVEGAVISDVAIYNRRLRLVVPADFEAIVSQARITRIWRKAKYALLTLENGYTIIWHFGMSGRVKILPNPPARLEKHDHIVITTSQGTLVFNDARRFGIMTYIQTASLSCSPFFRTLGLEPFDSALTPDYLLARFHHKKSSIKAALLDQHIINGIGNIYASEALYEARISPLRTASSLTKDESANLIKAVRLTLEKAIKAGGSTLRDYRQPDGSMGYFQHQHCVYGKTGQRCPNCCCNLAETGGISQIKQDGRSTYYCPTLQKEDIKK